MIKSKEIKVLTLSVLCCAVLTACGGGGENSLFIGKEKSPTTDENNADSTTDTNTSNTSNTSTDDEASNDVTSGPTTNHFLNSGVDKIAQQNDLIVASIKADGNKYSEVNFQQPGIVSQICNFKEGDCTNSVVERLEKEIELEKKSIEKEISSLEEKLEAEGVSENDKEEIKNKIIEKEKEKLDLDEALPQEGKRVIRDVNNNILRTVVDGTVDTINPNAFITIQNPGQVPLVLQDAGIIKRNELIKTNGSREVVGGLIDRDFNGVMLFQKVGDDNGQYIDAYMRDPAAPGWSYQTFGVFADNQLTDNNNRDLNIGYQSIGDKTPKIPVNLKQATYKGISHAYYNDKQVTSHNRIDVNFSDKTVKYRTEGTPLLHSFVGDPQKHILEEKPGYAVSADARLTSGTTHFEGTARTEDGMSGTLQGQFFGPNAEEIGGVYGFSGNNVHYLGGFGAKRNK